MNIKGLKLNEVGERIKQFLPPFLQAKFQFQESYQLEFDEISHNLPAKYHKFFKDDDIINNASGYVEDDSFEYNYTVILLSKEDYSQALFLLLQKEHKITNDIEIELLKSFNDKTKIKSSLNVDKITRYLNTISEIIREIEKDMNRLITHESNEELKRKLLELIQQIITILEELY